MAVVAFALAGSVLAIAYERASASQLFPGTVIGGVKVGSRSPDEAQALLVDRVVRPQQSRPVALRAHTTMRTTAGELGFRIDVAEAVRATYERQRSASIGQRLWRRVFGDGTVNRLRADVDTKRLSAFLAKASKQIDRPVRDATVEVHGAALKVVPHQVGRRLEVSTAGSRLVHALLAGDHEVRLPVELSQPTLRTEQFNKVILVHTGANRLDLYLDGKLSKSYPVATGTPGYPTPHGQFQITAKRMNPSWGNPWAPWSMDMPAYIGPGPNNPLGTRAMNLSIGGIRIHGTPDSGSIGGPASHGCIRMYMHDAEELFDIIDVGTPVLIVGG
jgi:lipoprotein-anchoring transpeptidase ErfK/SrfK